MSTRPVKKLKDSSGNNALIKVDIAVRDSQGRVIKDTYAEKSEIPTRLPAQGGNADYATNSGKVNNHTVESDVPANAVFTDTWPTTYATGASKSGHTLTITLNTGGSVSFTDTTYSNATTSSAGLMSSSDKTKLDGLNGSNYLAKAGGTMTGHLKWNDSSALPSATAAGLTGGLQYILGIKSFADGGDTVYETKANFLSGLVRYNEAQSLTDAQKTQARSNIGAGTGNGTVTKVDNVSPSSGNVSLSAVRYVSQSLTDAQKTQARANIGAASVKYRHNIRLYWSGGSGSGYASGTLYFSFKDTASGSYGASGFTHTLSTLMTFLATHCGMTGNVIKHLPVNGCAIKGNTTVQNLNYNTYTIIEIDYDNGSWYCDGTYLWQKKSTTPSGGKGIGYFSEIFPSNASGNYINIEDEVEED